MKIKIDNKLPSNDREYLAILTDELMTDLNGLIHPTKSTVQIDELSPFLRMIWLDHFDELFKYFDFDWLNSDRDAIFYIENNHVESLRPHGYLVPKITKSERKNFSIVAKHLQELRDTLSKSSNA